MEGGETKMKKFYIIGGSILFALVLIVSLVAYAGSDAKPQTVAVHNAEKHECGDCTAACAEKHATDVCEGHEPGACNGQCAEECEDECAENPAKCVEKHAMSGCTGHKPGECQKK